MIKLIICCMLTIIGSLLCGFVALTITDPAYGVAMAGMAIIFFLVFIAIALRILIETKTNNRLTDEAYH